MKYLNCGCGQRFHPDWTNIDSVARGGGIFVHDVKRGIPYPDHTFEVVYHSHLLEHFTKAEAVAFMCECSRVLKPGGIVRVVVPDLEQIARTYLVALEQAQAGSAAWAANYEWMMLELYDQTVRQRSGGEMAAYLSQASVPNAEFVLQRVGFEAKAIMEKAALKRQDACASCSKSKKRKHFMSWAYWRERMIKKLLGEEYAALQTGRFRQRGEIHQWMYDRYSLRLLLQHCKFTEVTQRTVTESGIPAWTSFHLDTAPDGPVYKPDSLYMEAIKPS